MIIFSFFSLKLYVVTPHLNHLIETVKMRGHSFYAELTKNHLLLSPNTPTYHRQHRKSSSHFFLNKKKKTKLQRIHLNKVLLTNDIVDFGITKVI